jgi:WD40 repeat protein
LNRRPAPSRSASAAEPRRKGGQWLDGLPLHQKAGGQVTRSPNDAARLFGYDLFISFALGPPPRGTRSYASDLARALREHDFTVFFSEDEAPPGEVLDRVLSDALRRSRILVVIVNRHTLEEPGFVRREVEEFGKLHPGRPVIPISVDKALEDGALVARAREWLHFEDKIWVDETADAVNDGRASPEVVDRLATAPSRLRSNVKWRWLVGVVIVILAALGVALAMAANVARTELRRATATRLALESQSAASGVREATPELTVQLAVAAFRLNPGPEALGALQPVVMTAQPLLPLVTTSSTVTAIAVSPKGNLIVSAGKDGVLRRWDPVSGGSLGEPLRGHRNEVRGLRFSRDGSSIVSASLDGTVRLWNLSMTSEPLVFRHGGEVRCADISPDGRTIASGGTDKTVRLWDTTTGRPLPKPFELHQHTVLSVAFSQDGRRIVSSSDDKTIRVWDVATRTQERAFDLHQSTVRTAEFSPSGDRVVSGGYDRSVRIWDIASDAQVCGPLSGHTAPILSVAYDPDGGRVVSGSMDGTVRVWDAKSCMPILEPLLGHRGWVWSVAFDPKGRRIYSGSSDKTLRIWRSDPVPSRLVLGDGKGHVQSVRFHSNGQIIASGGEGPSAEIWNVGTLQRSRPSPLEHSQPVTGVVTRGDGRIVAAASGDASVVVWNLVTGEVRELAGHSAKVRRLAFSGDGRRLYSASNDGSVRVWDPETGAPLGAPMADHDDLVIALAVGANGNNVVSGTRSGSIYFWDVEARTVTKIIERAHNDPVLSLALSPDEELIASGGADNVIRLWDAKTGTRVRDHPLTGHVNWVWSVRFTPDGHHIVSGSSDGTIRFWDRTRGTQVGKPWVAHSRQQVFSLDFSADGRSIASGGGDGLIRIWDAPSTWAEVACAKLTRNMSREDWHRYVGNYKYVLQCPSLPAPQE